MGQDKKQLIQVKLGNCYDYELPNDSIIVTDPPFNINYHYKGFKDKIDDDEYYTKLADLIRDRKAVIIHYPEALHQLSIKLGYAPTKVISWVYNSNTARQHRDIAFYNIKPDLRKIIQPYKNPTDKRIKERIARGIRGGRGYDWWNINQVKNVSKKEIDHPCVMPLQVMENIIKILPEGLIVDPFAGAGTTLLACLLNNRPAIGIEINKEYCDIIEKRLNKEMK